MKTLCVIVGAFALASSAWAGSATGKIKVCRYPGIVSMADGKPVALPAGTYMGACDKQGENCRNVIVAAEAMTIGAKKSDCAVSVASIETDDGAPLKKGAELRPQFSVQGFEAKVQVFEDFK